MYKDFAAIENIRKELARIEKSLLEQADPAQTIIHSLLDAQGKAMEAMTEVFRKASEEIRNQVHTYEMRDIPNSHTLDSVFQPLEEEGWEIMHVAPSISSMGSSAWRVLIRKPKVRISE